LHERESRALVEQLFTSWGDVLPTLRTTTKLAEAAAHNRRCRSFNNLRTRPYRRRTETSMQLFRMDSHVTDLTQTCNTNFRTVPKPEMSAWPAGASLGG
ncbi:MAG: hypothetical protein SGJ19_26120, partial [Planctomycetia bacterium]|nr:hypothetical protein [Planctomycetia bacterium]